MPAGSHDHKTKIVQSGLQIIIKMLIAGDVVVAAAAAIVFAFARGRLLSITAQGLVVSFAVTLSVRLFVKSAP